MTKFQAGSIVFFKDIADTSRMKGRTGVRFKGHGFGVLLGEVPPFGKDPDQVALFRCLGGIGYLSFDDVGEFLGDEAGAKCVAAFEAKYFPKTEEPKEGEELPTSEEQKSLNRVTDAMEKEPSRIMDIHGKPLEQ
jgi:hypothetical protein